MPQGEIPDTGRMGENPMDLDDGGRSKSGLWQDAVPEPPMVPDSGRQPIAKEGETLVMMTSVQP